MIMETPGRFSPAAISAGSAWMMAPETGDRIQPQAVEVVFLQPAFRLT